MTVSTAEGTWVVPPQQAVWIPAGIDHRVDCLGRVSMRSLYLHPESTAGLPAKCSVVEVTALLRELIVEAVRCFDDQPGDTVFARLAAVVLDQLRRIEAAPLDLPLPRDPRIRGLAQALRADPGDGRTLSQWAEGAGASPRTLARLFFKETGMTFASWRQRLRLQQAVARLGAGDTVTSVALDLGYQSPSAFVAMFRRTLGAPPGRYFRNAAPEPD